MKGCILYFSLVRWNYSKSVLLLQQLKKCYSKKGQIICVRLSSIMDIWQHYTTLLPTQGHIYSCCAVYILSLSKLINTNWCCSSEAATAAAAAAAVVAAVEAAAAIPKISSNHRNSTLNTQWVFMILECHCYMSKHIYY